MMRRGLLQWIVLVVVGIVLLVLFDRFTMRGDAWQKRLVEAVAQVRAEDSIAALRLADSLRDARARQAAEKARGDSLLHAADSAQASGRQLRRVLAGARRELDSARTLADTAAAQAAVIAAQDSIIRKDSTEKVALRATIASRDRQLADSSALMETRKALNRARSELVLLASAASNPPKEFRILGLKLALDPYIGGGLTFTTAGDVRTGLQLGVSFFHR
jgi:hypothetical protein